MVAHAQLWIQASTLLYLYTAQGRACASTELRALLSISISYHKPAFRPVQLAVLVDDTGFDVCGGEREARSAMVVSVTELDRVVMLVEDLQLSFAHVKTLVAASSKALAATVARDLEIPTSRVVSSPRNLSTWLNGAAGSLRSANRVSCKQNAGWGESHGSATVRAKGGRREKSVRGQHHAFGHVRCGGHGHLASPRQAGAVSGSLGVRVWWPAALGRPGHGVARQARSNGDYMSAVSKRGRLQIVGLTPLSWLPGQSVSRGPSGHAGRHRQCCGRSIEAAGNSRIPLRQHHLGASDFARGFEVSRSVSGGVPGAHRRARPLAQGSGGRRRCDRVPRRTDKGAAARENVDSI